MEADLFVLCRCVDGAQRDTFLEFLDEASRPLFDDEIEIQNQVIFKALEDTEYPQSLQNASDNSLFVHWWLGSRYQIDEMHPDMQALLTAGAEAVRALLYVDGEAQSLITATPGSCNIHYFDEDPLEGGPMPGSDNPAALIDFLIAQ